MSQVELRVPLGTAAAPRRAWWWRALIVGVGLGLWFLTQALLGLKGFPAGGIGDGIHQATAGVHAYLTVHRTAAHALLIASSTLINLLAGFVLWRAVFGPSLRPFVGLVILFASRQICQALTALPPPEGMIWEYPGFPGVLVRYEVSNDLFFSGHTALAVYGAAELARLRGWGWKALGVSIALFEMAAVLVLRAHYTMDVFAGAVTALVVQCLVYRGSGADRSGADAPVGTPTALCTRCADEGVSTTSGGATS